MDLDPVKTTRPQEWSSSSLENDLKNLQLDNEEATASIPAPTRTTSGVITHNMARNIASSSQLNSILIAKVNATYPQREYRPPPNSEAIKRPNRGLSLETTIEGTPAILGIEIIRTLIIGIAEEIVAIPDLLPAEMTTGTLDVRTVVTDVPTAETDILTAGTDAMIIAS
jgi:hypothetical protein